mmetsp:Transcript_33597/g.111125  ORF Transcript_33597/g.111125 Transcript_33597/m.111125 type:complete len:419 (-) Transcript_33597:912-2168(-)
MIAAALASSSSTSLLTPPLPSSAPAKPTATAAAESSSATAAAESSSAATAAKTVHLKISGKWYDATEWADRHPGGRYVLEWADGFDVTNAFHTIHLFSSRKASDILARLPEADLTLRAAREPVLPPIERVPMASQRPTGMDRFMGAGERVVELLSPPADATPEPVPVAPASGLAWQQRQEGAVGAVGETPLKADLEALLRRHFRSSAEYKATPEHWARIAAAFAVWAGCLAGWVAGSLPATLALPFAQWLLFSPTVHEASHSTLSTAPWVNKAAAFCGLPFVYNPYIWWPQHLLSHHQYTNDDALDVDLHHLRPARLHPGCEVDEGYGGANFIFKGYFSTMGMSVLWPVRVLQQKSTGRWRRSLNAGVFDALHSSQTTRDGLHPDQAADHRSVRRSSTHETPCALLGTATSSRQSPTR